MDLIAILIGLLIVVFLVAFVKLRSVRVWISAKDQHQCMTQLGVMDFVDNQTVPSVRLVGQSKSQTVGNVKIGDNGDNADVYMSVSDIDAENSALSYCGYINPEGYIFFQADKTKAPEQIGYTARPSRPCEPTVFGERSWKNLWMKCCLNAYVGEVPDNGKSKEPVACCQYVSLRSSKNDAMPPEARSAAFGLFFKKFYRHNYQEYLKTPYYGWNDTALLSAFFYALIYVLFYLVWVKILNNQFLGTHYQWSLPVFFAYFGLWALVRRYKIQSIERAHSIQPIVSLFNKSLGQNVVEWAIMICCSITLAFTWDFYQFDFVPLCLVVMIGIALNKVSKVAAKRWTIINPLSYSDTETELDSPIPNGDIVKNYSWRLDSSEKKDVTGNVSISFNAQYITDLRYVNPFFDQRKDKPIGEMVKDMSYYLNQHSGITFRLRYLMGQIEKICNQNLLLEQDKIQFVLDFVQEPNIRFCPNKDSKPISQYEDYIRYPDEVLYDQEADSNSKAFLAAMMFHHLEYNVLFLYSRLQHHGAIGIEVDPSWVDGDFIFGKPLEDATFVHNNKRYLFCETAVDGFLIGGTLEGMRFDDFEEKVLIPFSENEQIDTTDLTQTCVYNWDLDPRFGKSLHGTYTLEFYLDRIADLRNDNPFRDYAVNGGDYGENIQRLFKYLADDNDRKSYIREIANYIRQTINDNNLGEVHLIQFALDFCQEPNIRYCIDERSQGISFAKEYMRFPDEVLFDKEGDCDCKTSLACALFHELGYNVIAMLSKKLQHAAVGIECKDEWFAALNVVKSESNMRQYNGKNYLYCETTGDGFAIGQIRENESIQDFETVVELNK